VVQCVAVCCRMLQRVAVRCSVVSGDLVMMVQEKRGLCCSVLQGDDVCVCMLAYVCMYLSVCMCLCARVFDVYVCVCTCTCT